MNTAWELLGHRALSALGNGLYQGMLVALAVGIALQFLRGANAATRYAVALGALVIVTALPAVHFVAAGVKPSSSSVRGQGNEPGTAVPGGATPDTSPSPEVSGLHAALDSTKARTPDKPADGGQNDPARNHPMPARSAVSPWADAMPRAAAVDSATRRGGDAPAAFRRRPFVASQNAVTENASVQKEDRVAGEPVRRAFPLPGVAGLWQPAVPAGVSLGVLALWLIMAALRVARLGWQYAALQRLKSHCEPAPVPVAARFEVLRGEMAVTRAVRLGVGRGLTSPVAAGFFRPAVLLPAGLLPAGEAELDAVLRHELAHLNRRDDWTNLLQQLVQAALFFHPGVWWLSRRLTLDREIACDDHVLAGARSPRDYALFLAEFAGRTPNRLGAAAPAAWSNRSQLKERIHMILDANRNASPRLARARVSALSTAAALIAAAAWYAGPRLAIAQAGPVTAAASTAPAWPEPPAAGAPRLKGPQPAASPRLPEAAVRLTAPISPAAPAATPYAVGQVQAAMPLAVAVSPAGGPGGVVAAVRPGKGPGPMVLAAPNPVPSPHPAPKAYVMAGPGPGDDFGRRLERLERMVERLMMKLEKTPPGTPTGEKSKDGGADALSAGQPKGLIKEGVAEGLGPGDGPDFARMMEQVARDVEQAVQHAERAAAEGQRSAERARMRVEKAALKRQPLEHERHALHAQREALQRQVEAIEQQMERLEEHLERVDEQLEQVGEHIEEITEGHEELPEAEPARPEAAKPAATR